MGEGAAIVVGVVGAEIVGVGGSVILVGVGGADAVGVEGAEMIGAGASAVVGVDCGGELSSILADLSAHSLEDVDGDGRDVGATSETLGVGGSEVIGLSDGGVLAGSAEFLLSVSGKKRRSASWIFFLSLSFSSFLTKLGSRTNLRGRSRSTSRFFVFTCSSRWPSGTVKRT